MHSPFMHFGSQSGAVTGDNGEAGDDTGIMGYEGTAPHSSRRAQSNRSAATTTSFVEAALDDDDCCCLLMMTFFLALFFTIDNWDFFW